MLDFTQEQVVHYSRHLSCPEQEAWDRERSIKPLFIQKMRVERGYPAPRSE